MGRPATRFDRQPPRASPHRQHLIVRDHEDPVIRIGDDRRQAREAAERGEYRRPRAEPVAREALALQPRSRQHDPGMEVARQGISVRRLGRLMAEHEGRHERRPVDAVDPEILRRIAGVAVVVAAHEEDLELRPEPAPAAKLRERTGRDPARPRVEEIAEHDEAAGTGPEQDGVEPGEVVARGPDRDRDARRPEGGAEIETEGLRAITVWPRQVVGGLFSLMRFAKELQRQLIRRADEGEIPLLLRQGN